MPGLNVTREQLQKLCGNDQRLVLAFENIFVANAASTPTDLSSLSNRIDAVSNLVQTIKDLADSALSLANVASQLAEYASLLSSTANQKADEANANALRTILANLTITSSVIASSVISGSITNTDNRLVTMASPLPNNAGAALGTLGNAPTVGNPTKWIPINDGGTTRYIPTWT